MKKPALLMFVVLELMTIGFLFRDCLWGRSLFCPLDIAPALFGAYQYADPEMGRVPANHYTIDALTIELPMQYTVYQAYQRGEVPWWDPYTLCGAPMLADGHVHATDWVRLLLYSFLPFELAFNWARVAYFVIAGVGMLVLIRRYGFNDWLAVALAITYQFAGCQAIFVMHPWIPSSMMFYPWLWWAWHRLWVHPTALGWVLATLLVTGAICSGSIQTNSYLAIFGFCFAIGHVARSWDSWLRVARVVLIPGGLAALITAPLLLAQLEYFVLGGRGASAITNRLGFLSGLLSLSALFPWSLGTFRTLDLSKFVGQSALGYSVYVGSTAMFLAVVGAFHRAPTAELRGAKRMAVALVVSYLFLISTPLLNLLYLRFAALPSMGLVVLAALGLRALLVSEVPWRRTASMVGMAAILASVAINVVALLVYPRVLPKVQALVAERDKSNVTFGSAPQLREFQVANLPNEVSFRNPETALAIAGVLLLGAVMVRPALRKDMRVLGLLAVLNAVPLILFCARYSPRHDVAIWHRIRDAGPLHARVLAEMSGSPLRLWDQTEDGYQKLMPLNFPHIYRVRSVHGYAALLRGGFYGMPVDELEKLAPFVADRAFMTQLGDSSLKYRKIRTDGFSRFVWKGDQKRSFTAEDFGLNETRLRFEPGGDGTVIWTDTRYPGWQVLINNEPVEVASEPPFFSAFQVPADATEVVLRFRPRFLSVGLFGSMAGFAVLCGVVWGQRRATYR